MYIGFVGVNSFKRLMTAHSERVYREGVRAIKREMGVWFEELVRITPKDTNFASSNWKYVQGTKPPSSVIVNPRGGSYSPASTPSFSNIRMGPNVYIYNNVAYMRRLEHGWSKQAPLNFIRNSARRADRRLQTRFNAIV